MVSVSRATSAAGISTEISRFTPSFFASFLRSTVSVGLTLPFRPPGTPGHSHAVHLSVKTEGEQRQTAKAVVASNGRGHNFRPRTVALLVESQLGKSRIPLEIDVH